MNRRNFLKGCMVFAAAATVPVFVKPPKYLTDNNAWFLKRDAKDIIMASDEERSTVALALALRRTKEQHAAAIFNQAFA